jgi:hypothetical protein
MFHQSTRGKNTIPIAAIITATVMLLTCLQASLQVWAQEPVARPKLTWAPPVLTEPITIEITEKKTSFKLDQTKDYILKMPSRPLQGGLNIWGGRNVVLIGGEIHIPTKEEAPDFKGSTRALYIQQQKGTIHIEGLLVSGGGLTEGVNFNQRLGGIVQFQNMRFDTVHGERSGHHADLIQTWAGPTELRIDRFTGHTSYQGFFLLPNQHFQTVEQNGVVSEAPKPRLFDFRNINLIGTDRSAYMLWLPTPPGFPLNLQEVWVKPSPKKDQANRDQFLWPKPSTGDTSWAAVKVGIPPEGDFVPAGVAGVNYVSPGYLEQKTAP